MGVISCVLNAAVCDRYPCRAWFAIFRCQLLVMTTVIATGLGGGGVGLPMAAVAVALFLELCMLLIWRPYQHTALNYIKAVAVGHALLITCAALWEASADAADDEAAPAGHAIESCMTIGGGVLWGPVALVSAVTVAQKCRAHRSRQIAEQATAAAAAAAERAAGPEWPPRLETPPSTPPSAPPTTASSDLPPPSRERRSRGRSRSGSRGVAPRPPSRGLPAPRRAFASEPEMVEDEQEEWIPPRRRRQRS